MPRLPSPPLFRTFDLVRPRRVGPRALPACLVACCIALLCLPRVAWAGEPTNADLARARELFARGQQLQEQEKWQRAYDSYQRAVAIKDTPGLRYRLGYCQERLGRLVEAGVQYRRAAQLLERGADGPDVAALLPETIASLDRRTPHVLLRLEHPPSQLQFSIDGVQLSAALLNHRVALDPGTHVVRLSAPGYRDYSRNVVLQEGDLSTLEVGLTPSPPPPPAEVAPPHGGGSAGRVVVLAAELALAASGTALGLVQLDEMGKLETRIEDLQRGIDAADPSGTGCSDPVPDLSDECARVRNTIHDYDMARNWMRAGFITAGVSATAAVVTYLVWPSDSPAVGVLWFEGGGGAALHGSF